MSTNVIHIGLPKCASTTLQDRLFAAQQRFLYLGRIKNGYCDASTRELFERITFQDSLDYDADVPAALLQSLRSKRAASAASAQRSVLVSAESLSVAGRADRRLIAERLHRLFAPAKVLIVVRSQPTMLQSLYLNHLRGSGQHLVSFEQWLGSTYGGVRFTDMHRVGLDYDALVRLYEDVFGAENVVVLPFEQIADENSPFVPTISALLEMPAAEVRACLKTNVENQRMSGRHLLALRFQDRLPGETNLARLGRRLLPLSLYAAARRFVVGGRRISSPALPERWRAEVAAVCGESNARLAKRRVLPLAELGYPIALEFASAVVSAPAALLVSIP
jgi:hypothetical protein